MDYTAAYALAGALGYPSVRARLLLIGADLFEPGAERAVARAVLTDLSWHPPRRSGPATLASAEALARAVADADASGIVDSEAYAHRLVSRLACQRHRDLLLAALAWAVAEIRRGAPARRVLRQLLSAYGVAAGRRPLEPGGDWLGVA